MWTTKIREIWQVIQINHLQTKISKINNFLHIQLSEVILCDLSSIRCWWVESFVVAVSIVMELFKFEFEVAFITRFFLLCSSSICCRLTDSTISFQTESRLSSTIRQRICMYSEKWKYYYFKHEKCLCILLNKSSLFRKNCLSPMRFAFFINSLITIVGRVGVLLNCAGSTPDVF